MRYLSEKIDLSSVDATYLTLLIFASSILIGIFIAFKEQIVYSLFIITIFSILLFSLLFSLFCEVKAIFNGKMGGRRFSFWALYFYSSSILWLLIINIINRYYPTSYWTNFLIGILILSPSFLFLSKTFKWFEKKFPIHTLIEKKEYEKQKYLNWLSKKH